MYEFAVTPAVTNIRRRGVEISEVAPEQPGRGDGARSRRPNNKGQRRVVRDYLDFRFQTAGETELVLEVRKKSGDDWEVELERAEGEDFGLSSSRSFRASARTNASSVSVTAILRMRGRRFY